MEGVGVEVVSLMAIDYSQFAFPKGAPLKVGRAIRKAKRQGAMQKAYRLVDVRDGSKCWVTRLLLSPGATDPRARREHHHLQPRSTHPERIADPTNIITVSGLAHTLIEAGMIVVEGTTTEKPIRFHWRADVTKEQRVLVIKSRRRSQQ